MIHASSSTDFLPADKSARYEEVESQILAVLDGETDVTARMATVAALLKNSFEAFYWAGFYVVDENRPDELVVGPYQGTLGCLRIAFGRGVCGAAASTGEIQIVPDVDAFPGHIACDHRSRSEIVVPVRRPDGRLLAVFDVDAVVANAFDEVDARGLNRILQRVFSASTDAVGPLKVSAAHYPQA